MEPDVRAPASSGWRCGCRPIESGSPCHRETPWPLTRIARTIAAEIAARPEQLSAAASLLDGGATVPFVARYRKEATGGLDDTQLRTLSDRLAYLRELEARRATILGSIRDEGKLTPKLGSGIAGAASKAALEGHYLPFRPKRRTRAAIAGEKGLGPLAEAILAKRRTSPKTLAETYPSDDVPDAKEAHRRAARPSDPPCPHSRIERPVLPPRPEQSPPTGSLTINRAPGASGGKFRRPTGGISRRH